MRWILILVSIWRWAGLGEGMPSNPTPYDGTYHFVSSAFPEMDSRGFYEHLFDDIGDYYPTWRRANYKDYSDGNSLEPEEAPPQVSVIRSKRSIISNSSDQKQESHKNNDMTKAKGGVSNDDKQDVEMHLLGKRSPSRHARGMEMGSSGFHEDTFNSAFGDFVTMRRRRIARTALQNNKINDILLKMSLPKEIQHTRQTDNDKLSQQLIQSFRNPENINRQIIYKDNESDLDSLFHGLHNLIKQGRRMEYFRDSPLSKIKRRPEMDSSGFHGDTFGSFGDFDTMRKKSKAFKTGNLDFNMYSDPYSTYRLFKRRPEMDSAGFHGDTFGGSFGDFDTMKKRRPEMDSAGFHGDMFGGSFGDFDTMKKRRPEMDSSGFHGDTFGGSFGEFDTMKKRRPEMDSAGFHGDVFGGSFGDFDTMKKRRPEMDSSGFHGDTFRNSFGEFDTMKKRRPEMDSSGFHGDMFGSFGDFDTMKKRRPEMDSSGFHGDTFGSFGDFDTMKKRSTKVVGSGPHGDSTNKECNCEILMSSPQKDTKMKYRFDDKCLLNCPKTM